MSENLSKIQRILSEQLGINEMQVTPEAKIYDDLGADSLDAVELMMEIEEVFEIETSDEFWENENLTVQDIVDLVD